MNISWSINKGEPDSRFGPEVPSAEYNAIGFPPAWDDRPWIAGLHIESVNHIVAGKNISVSHINGRREFPGNIERMQDPGADADFAWVANVRAYADAVMWGAETLRREQNIIPDLRNDAALHKLRTAHDLPYYPRLILITNSGGINFSLPAFHTNLLDVIVLTNEMIRGGLGARARSSGADRTTVIGRGARELDMAAGLRHLRHAFGMTMLLCEGGISLLKSLKADGLLDEIFVTTSDITIPQDAVENPKYMFDFAKEKARLVAYGKAGQFEFRRWRFNERN